MSSLLTGGQSFNAGGTINPGTFVKLDTTADRQVLAAGANAKVYGVAQNFPGSYATYGGSEPAAATIGQQVMVFTAPAIALLTLGSGGCTRGDYLESDASGNGVTSSTSGHFYGGVALESGNSGDQVLVELQNGTIH